MSEVEETPEEEDLRLNPQAASIFTGIDSRHLQGMLQGELIPDWVHSERIDEKLGAEIAEQYKMASLDEEPEYIKTRKGLPPEGCQLLRQVQVPDLMVGDYLPYSSRSEDYGSLWVRVDEINDEDSSATHRLVCLGGLWTDLVAGRSCKVARSTD